MMPRPLRPADPLTPSVFFQLPIIEAANDAWLGDIPIQIWCKKKCCKKYKEKGKKRCKKCPDKN